MTNPAGFDLEHVTKNAFRMLRQAGQVADTALRQIEAGTYDGAAWSKSVIALMDINTQGYVNCMTSALGGAGGEDDPEYSADITVEADLQNDRELHIASMVRVGTTESVPLEFVGVEPEVLTAGKTTFRIFVTDLRYVAANYDATVNFLRRVDAAAQPAGHCVVPVAL